jgi:hypothetical protein
MRSILIGLTLLAAACSDGGHKKSAAPAGAGAAKPAASDTDASTSPATQPAAASAATAPTTTQPPLKPAPASGGIADAVFGRPEPSPAQMLLPAVSQGACGNLTAWSTAPSIETMTRAIVVGLDLDAMGIKHPLAGLDGFNTSTHEFKIANLPAGAVTLHELDHAAPKAFDHAFCTDIGDGMPEASQYPLTAGRLILTIGQPLEATSGKYTVPFRLEEGSVIFGNDAVETLDAVTIEGVGGWFPG